MKFSICENNREQKRLFFIDIDSSVIPRVGEAICIEDNQMGSAMRGHKRKFIVKQVYHVFDCSGYCHIRVLVDPLEDICKVHGVSDSKEDVFNPMNIRELSYDLYKQDWVSTHIEADQVSKSMKEYYVYSNKCFSSGDAPEDYNSWLARVGYDGYMFVCFEEFCENEYRDEGYIKMLLGDDEGLISQYLKDVNQL